MLRDGEECFEQRELSDAVIASHRACGVQNSED